MMLMRHAAVDLAPFAPETLGDVIYDVFRTEPDRLLAAVVDPQGRPLGLVERHSFFLRIASEYGRALYARRPISLLMQTDPLVVEGDRAISEFTAATLTARASDLLKGFIVTEDGRYAGVGAALSLLRVVNDQALRNAGDLKIAAEELRFAHAAVAREKLFIDTVVENIPTMLTVKSAADDRFLLVNRAAEELLGYTREELIGRHASEVFPAEEAAAITEQDRQVRASGHALFVEERVRRKTGEERRFSTRKLAVADETGAARWVLCVSEDVTDRREAQARIERLAHYDPLTGLSNRALFGAQLQGAVDAAARDGAPAAVFCIDLDHFKAVNDTLGHGAGDALLGAVAERLRACIRVEDAVARLGGDEFAIVQASVETPDAARRLAARIVETLSQPYEIGGQQAVIGASVGVALHPQDGREPDELLKRADMALYRAKAQGRGRYQMFLPEMDAELQARRRMEIDLRRALKHGELTLHFQPQFDLAADRVGGCEALVRWNHPQRGLVPPGEFIGLAEEIGLIRPLGEWVLRAACEEAALWPDHVRLAVNVSPIQFRDRRLARAVTSALGASGLRADRLELEITESVLLQDDEANLRVLHQLKTLGCRIALDDFGTGFSSLSYLRRFPFDKIKIDRAFVKDLPGDKGSLAIIRAVTTLAQSLGMSTTAEGVETPGQLRELKRVGCDQIQGFLLGRPMAAEPLRRLLAPSAASARDPDRRAA